MTDTTVKKSPAEAMVDLTNEIQGLRTDMGNVEDRLTALENRPTPSSNSGTAPDVGRRLENIETNFGELVPTLQQFETSLNGESIASSVTSLNSAATTLTRAGASATEAAQKAVADAAALQEQTLRSNDETRGAAKRAIEDVQEAKVDELSDGVAARADAAKRDVADLRKDVASVRESFNASAAWSFLGAIALALLPVATVAVAACLAIWAVVTGWQFVVLGADVSLVWRIVRGVGVVLGTGGGLFALFVAARWLAEAFDSWRSAGTSWRSRWPFTTRLLRRWRR